jgi:hypothetical protein
VDNRARGFFVELGRGDNRTLEADEAKALWAVSRESGSVRERIVQIALARPGDARQFMRRADETLHAVVGLDSAMRISVRDGAIRSCDPKVFDENDQQAQACVFVITSLRADTSESAVWLAEAMEQTTNSDRLTLLGSAIGDLGERLDRSSRAAIEAKCRRGRGLRLF